MGEFLNELGVVNSRRNSWRHTTTNVWVILGECSEVIIGGNSGNFEAVLVGISEKKTSLLELSSFKSLWILLKDLRNTKGRILRKDYFKKLKLIPCI